MIATIRTDLRFIDVMREGVTRAANAERRRVSPLRTVSLRSLHAPQAAQQPAGGGGGGEVEGFSGSLFRTCKTWNLDPRRKVETENHTFLTTFRPENVGLIFPNPTPKKLDGKVATFPEQHRKRGLTGLKT